MPVAIYVQKPQSTSFDSLHVSYEVEDACAQVEVDVDPCPRPFNGQSQVTVASAPATQCRNIPSSSGPPSESSRSNKGKEIVMYNPFEVLGADTGDSEEESEQITQNTGPNKCSPTAAPP
ncbi:UNVERIFIED_CONTAM: hypothetical protein Sradi_7151700 [Sesamum radiatum]|uniref:Uncharacterized protein n=1 Tax=Sesamum radiatum TaxID=300843 RepID=A0AAW2IW45_SESRA